MNNVSSLKIVFIGAGNLATNLANELKKNKYKIIQIYSRTLSSAISLADAVGAKYTNDLKKINKEADVYFLSVTDDAILEVLENINLPHKLLVHTAGSVNSTIFESFTDQYGVFYPLQTFSKQRVVEFNTIPICVEANTQTNLEILKRIACSISSEVYEINSIQRLILHIAAVFSCNFVNHLYALSDELLKKHDLHFEILDSLIKETTEKALKNSPNLVQTGPAYRNDVNTIKRHIDFLSDYDNLKNIYCKLTNSIKQINRNDDRF